jgi:hypothetical protein
MQTNLMQRRKTEKIHTGKLKNPQQYNQVDL